MNPIWKSKGWRFAELVAFALGVFILTIWLVVRYEDVIDKVNWRLVSIISAFLLGMSGMAYYVSRPDNNYVVLDLLTHENGRADFERHVVTILLVLTVWVVVQNVLDDKDVSNILLGALGIFIIKRVADRATDAYKSKPAAPTMVPASGPTQVNAPNAETVVIPEGDGVVSRPRKKAK